MFGLNSLNSLFCYNGPLWTIMDRNRVVLAIMEKSVFPDAPHPVEESENASQLPEGFFAESPSHPNVCNLHLINPFLTSVFTARYRTSYIPPCCT